MTFSAHTDEPGTNYALTRREQAAREIGPWQGRDTPDEGEPRISALIWIIPATLFWAMVIAAVLGAM